MRIDARGTGGVTVHLRGIDAVDVFFVLNGATKEGFIVNSEVRGRADVDFEKATPEEALAAIRAAGIAVSAGPLHLVGSAVAVPARQ